MLYSNVLPTPNHLPFPVSFGSEGKRTHYFFDVDGEQRIATNEDLTTLKELCEHERATGTNIWSRHY